MRAWTRVSTLYNYFTNKSIDERQVILAEGEGWTENGGVTENNLTQGKMQNNGDE